MSVANAQSLYEIPLKTLDGKDASLAPNKGKVILVVNVASQCGLTPQYKGLQALYDKYKDKGLVVAAFPCNQFGGQEPGSPEEIKNFCSGTYNVTFPLFAKIDVNGPNRHPLYKVLAGEGAAFPGDISWNFAKFLVGKDGKVLARFDPTTKPEDPQIVEAVEKALQ